MSNKTDFSGARNLMTPLSGLENVFVQGRIIVAFFRLDTKQAQMILQIEQEETNPSLYPFFHFFFFFRQDATQAGAQAVQF